MKTPTVSFVIPAFNEERFIGQQLVQLRERIKALEAEIIVADNHSSDRTVELARASGADRVIQAAGTVAAVRNRGAALARGEVLIFMDADVFPTDGWAKRLPTVLASLERNPLLLTGSWVSVPDHATWIERFWFKPLESRANSHINSGHMILHRQLFESLQGFDERLRTGEDFDLSVRARELGGVVVDDSSLKVIHEGYPKSLREFLRREMWHGTGDCRTVRTFLRSKVALVGFAVFHGQVLGLGLSLYFTSLNWVLASCGASLALSSAAAFSRYSNAPLLHRAVNTFLYYAYFLARGASPYAAMLRKGGKKASGSSRH